MSGRKVNLNGNPHAPGEHKGCSKETCYYSLSRGAMIERKRPAKVKKEKRK